MESFALINLETRKVENIVALNSDSIWQPPDGFVIEPLAPNTGIGWFFINGEWVLPQPDPAPDQPASTGTQEL